MTDPRPAERVIIIGPAWPQTWTVEAYETDGDGGVDVTTFSGPDAERRAREYARWAYGREAVDFVGAKG